MSGSSEIEWTDAVWNPIRGCSIVSAGCTNCYAMRYAHRFSSPGFPYEGLTKSTHGGPVWTGEVRTVPGVLDVPLRWKQPKRIFVNSMSDLFHEGVPDEFIDKVFAVMAIARKHVFQILTKRPERALAYFIGRSRSIKYWEAAARAIGWTLKFGDVGLAPFPLPNVWLGVSIEDQRSADERIPLLLQTPAAVRFLSCEPLIGRIDLCETFGMWWNSTMQCFDGTGSAFNRRGREGLARPGIDWVIVGGESGPGARPFDVAWARAIVGQCKAAGVPVFVKQLGSNLAPLVVEAGSVRERLFLKARKGGDPQEWPEDLRVREYPV